MKKTLIASLIGLALTPPAYSAENIELDDVVVTATRTAQSSKNVIADVTVIDREEIERSGQSTLVQLLRTQPGVQIMTSGGVGGLANIHIRGNSSKSAIILVDGLRMASATTGTTKLSQIQPENIERIEIVKGPASSLYGPDAIGGVIQIFTKKGQKGLQATGTLGYGSNDTKKAAATLNGGSDNTRFSLGISNITTRGISAYRTRTGFDADRDAYRNLSVNGNVTHSIAEGHEIGAQVYHSKGRNRFDDNNLDSFSDSEQNTYAITSKNKILDSWTSNILWGQGMDDLYSAGSSGITKLRTKQRQFSWQNDITLPLGTLVLAYDRLEDRVSGNVDYSTNKRFNNGYLASYFLNKDSHTFKAGVRRDNNSQFGQNTTGNIGYGYKFTDNWKAAASYGTAFRAPTFNDLYWPYQDFGIFGTYEGNADLKPEKSRNKELTVTYEESQHQVKATVFHNTINNLLICCQGLFNDSPTNVGSATIKGVGLSYDGFFADYHLRANADFQDPRDDGTGKTLARIAKAYGSIWLGKEWNDWSVGGEMIISGRRYNDSDNSVELGGYSLFNITAKYIVDPDWSLSIRGNNIFNKKYALSTRKSTFNPTAPDFNTDGGNVFISIRYAPSN